MCTHKMSRLIGAGWGWQPSPQTQVRLSLGSHGWSPVPTSVPSAPAQDVGGGWTSGYPPPLFGLSDSVRGIQSLWYGLSFPLSPRAPSPDREGSEDLDRLVFMGESFED